MFPNNLRYFHFCGRFRANWFLGITEIQMPFFQKRGPISKISSNIFWNTSFSFRQLAQFHRDSQNHDWGREGVKSELFSEKQSFWYLNEQIKLGRLKDRIHCFNLSCQPSKLTKLPKKFSV